MLYQLSYYAFITDLMVIPKYGEEDETQNEVETQDEEEDFINKIL